MRDAFPAAGALGKVHKSGLLSDPGREGAGLAVQSHDFGMGQQLDIQMPADLDQFGRDDSHGTIICWKGLIQLGHQPADSRGSIDQMHVIAGIGKIQGRLHASYSAPNNHDRA